MVPFLYEEIYAMIKSLLKRILLKSAYDAIKSSNDIFKIDFSCKKFIVDPKDVDIYNSARAGIQRKRSKLTTK